MPPGRPKAKKPPWGAASPHSGRSVGAFFCALRIYRPQAPVSTGTGAYGRRSMRGCRDARAYAPVQAGARFSMKARTPSWKSADI
ncbi:Uncharacterised protein [Bordetella pertussis]|nr:Uncharacterised protein [Bordetella pertussis]